MNLTQSYLLDSVRKITGTKIHLNLMKLVRSYTLKIYGSKSKFNDLEWSSYQYTKLVNSFINHLYFNDNVDFYSTKGLGLLGNQAQRKAKGIVCCKKINEKENKHKRSCPQMNATQCFANIEKLSSNNHFNYKINFISGFGFNGKSRFIFSKGINPLKKALKQNWKLSDQCEVFKANNGKWFVKVFVSKEIKKATAKTKSIGIDVGINQIISTSERFLGNSLSNRLKKINKSKNEKRKQLSLAKNKKDLNLVNEMSKSLTKNKNIHKTIIKQLLDKEAKRLIARGLTTSSNLVVEDPKVLAKLTNNKYIVNWAKTYFAYRLQVLGKETGVFVVFTNPANTSITCSKCGDKDKENRDGIKFHCLKCGHSDHADINAAVNLARKGQEFVDFYVIKSKPKKLINNNLLAVRAL